MKKLCKVLQSDVWEHWKKVEKFEKDNFRNDIRGPLPKDLDWYLAEIEEDDLNRLYIISSDDWSDISRGTFRVLEVVNRLYDNTENQDTNRISLNIKSKLDFISSGGELDTFLIAVTDKIDMSGPITFIEGNRRSIAFCSIRKIVGNQIYIGVSSDVTKYIWARKD